jgi:hypothetical protein
VLLLTRLTSRPVNVDLVALYYYKSSILASICISVSPLPKSGRSLFFDPLLLTFVVPSGERKLTHYALFRYQLHTNNFVAAAVHRCTATTQIRITSRAHIIALIGVECRTITNDFLASKIAWLWLFHDKIVI